jgi:hypothetical protein
MRDLVQQAVVQQAMRRVHENADRLVLPAIVAIYERPDGSDRATKQIGTGFRINWSGRLVLVTARHTLYGHRYDKEPEDPFTKHIVFNGRLRGLFELRTREVGYLEGHDLAAVFVGELGLPGSLPMSCLLPTEPTCRLVSIYGLLARDFRRELSTGSLRPRPYIYTNKRAASGLGYAGVFLPKHRNRDGRTHKIVQAPRPVGLSGGPMLDANKLLDENVSIVGVFTDYRQWTGHGLGESAWKVIALLQQLAGIETRLGCPATAR